jgi:hypothetical protein
MDVHEKLDTIFSLTETLNMYFIGLHNGDAWLVGKTVLSRLTVCVDSSRTVLILISWLVSQLFHKFCLHLQFSHPLPHPNPRLFPSAKKKILQPSLAPGAIHFNSTFLG